jgi:ABC-2 type transport system ATP-binding protein
MPEVLRTHHLVKRYDSKPAVDGVDLVVDQGERVALLGPNGAGKTTTLMMLFDVIRPDEGFVEICGHRLPQGRTEALEQVGFSAGYMPLAERLRVSEFLAMYAALYGLRDSAARIEAQMERFRVAHLLDSMSTRLSAGQRTLIGIVKATLHRPRLLVLDEPTASLDPDVALRVRNGLRSLCDDEGTALLITSHNMVEVERLCERVVFLSQGRVIVDETPEAAVDAFGREDLEGLFLHLAGEDAPQAREAGYQETDRA